MVLQPHLDFRGGYPFRMADEFTDMLEEIMELTGDKQARLGKRLGVAQSTIHRWLNRQSRPSLDELAKVRIVWRKVKGIRLTLDDMVAPYDETIQDNVRTLVDNYLRLLPPPKR